MDGVDKLLTIKEVSKHLGLTPTNVKRHCKLGHLKHIIVGRWTYRFYKKDITKFQDEFGMWKPYKKQT